MTKANEKSYKVKFVMLDNQRVTTNCSKLLHYQCGSAGGECGCHD